MSATRGHRRAGYVRRTAAAVISPTVAFYVAALVGTAVTTGTTIDVGRFALAAPFYLALVGAPSGLVVWAATERIRTATVAAMTVVAAFAGWLVATTDDAQAGLAVLAVWYLAAPLTVVMVLARWAVSVSRRNSAAVR